MTDEYVKESENGEFVFSRPVKADEVMNFAKQLIRRSAYSEPHFGNSARTREWLTFELGNEEREIFCCLFLTNQHHLISFDKLFYGTIDGAAVYPREVVKRALSLNAAAVILAHNHPSGVSEPSQADIAITGRVKDALSLVDIRVLDHIVIGNTGVTSLAERRLL